MATWRHADFEYVLGRLDKLAQTPGVLMAWSDDIRQGAAAIRELIADRGWADLQIDDLTKKQKALMPQVPVGQTRHDTDLPAIADLPVGNAPSSIVNATTGPVRVAPPIDDNWSPNAPPLPTPQGGPAKGTPSEQDYRKEPPPDWNDFPAPPPQGR